MDAHPHTDPVADDNAAVSSAAADRAAEADGSDGGTDTVSHDLPLSEHLQAAIAKDWDPAPAMPHPAARANVAGSAGEHRAELSRRFPGRLIVVPAGNAVPRANDTDFPFRAASAFTWLTGETVVDAVLVMMPSDGGHESTLYIREYAQPGEVAYFTSRHYGAVWVGNVPSLADTWNALALPTRPRAALAGDLSARADDTAAVLTGIDAGVDALLPRGRREELAETIDELRLVKNDWELERLRTACDSTSRGFADVVRELPNVIDRADLRGERWLEGTFWRRARLEGNEVGYTSIVASGAHATHLHWWRNHGVVRSGELLLADMGVETDELYTADVTRTMPVSGTWTDPQRQVYRAVLEAQTAGIAEVRAGADFLSAHRAAMWVLADHLHHWGVIDVPAEVSCSADTDRPGAGLHRRYTLHGVSHMLGIDVHDCALAREETYREGTLAPGYVLTVEPGLYFQPHDLTVPAELRGIGVRIEDDIAVTAGDPENLSGQLPRDPDELVAWMRDVQGTPAVP